MMQAWSAFYRRFKFLPMTFGVALIALIARIEVAQEHAKQGLFITTAFVEAQDKSADAKKSDAAAAPAAPADAKAADKSMPAAADAAAAPDPLNTENQPMRPSGELSIIKDLSDRRAAIEKREADLNEREALLDASQKQFDQKLKQLTDMRNEIKAMLAAAKVNEDDETKRLIDIYEKMKPKDAAGIFATMNPDILFPIVHGMKEAKLSPILAAMPPDKARAITAQLTVKAKILPEDSPTVAAAAAVTAPPPANDSIRAQPPAPPAQVPPAAK